MAMRKELTVVAQGAIRVLLSQRACVTMEFRTVMRKGLIVEVACASLVPLRQCVMMVFRMVTRKELTVVAQAAIHALSSQQARATTVSRMAMRKELTAEEASVSRVR
jgi:hypothetical protein